MVRIKEINSPVPTMHSGVIAKFYLTYIDNRPMVGADRMNCTVTLRKYKRDMNYLKDYLGRNLGFGGSEGCGPRGQTCPPDLRSCRDDTVGAPY